MNFKNICIFFALYNFIRADNLSSEVSYKGNQVWQVDIGGKNVSQEFIDKIHKEDVWRSDENSIDFLLSPNKTTTWEEFLRTHNISYKVLLKDVQEKIDKEALMKNEGGRRAGKLTWTSYPNLKDIYAFLDEVASKSKSCSLSVIGQTAHKTDIKMIKLSNGIHSNPAILIDGGMHAREWTSIVSVLYFIDAIARNYSQQPPFITNNDWYIIPVINPDGYVFSTTKDRLWRKNRRYFSGPCDGVDINRNFDFTWCQKGGSNSICSPNYCGVSPFSEAESTAIKNLISQRHFLAYISVRSYGKKILFPWASRPAPSADIRDHIRISNAVASAMHAVDKEIFKTGSINRAGRESGAGMSVDWTYSQGVVHSYMVETRGEGIGAYFLEPEQILIAVKEVYAGLLEFARIM